MIFPGAKNRQKASNFGLFSAEISMT